LRLLQSGLEPAQCSVESPLRLIDLAEIAIGFHNGIQLACSLEHRKRLYEKRLSVEIGPIFVERYSALKQLGRIREGSVTHLAMG
jgi:hypothetical protein